MTATGFAIGCVFVQVALTIWAILATGRARLEVLKSRKLHFDEVALSTDAYPEPILKLQNSVRNQFELPVLFYAAICLGVALDAINWPIAILALIFSASRIVHRHIHITSNHLPTRFKAFVLGLAAVTLIWLILGLNLLF